MTRREIIAKLKAVEPELRARGVAALYLFGSYARDEARENSDIDVFIDKVWNGSFGLDELVDSHAIVEKAVGSRVDYGTRDGLVKFYRPAIENEAVRVF